MQWIDYMTHSSASKLWAPYILRLDSAVTLAAAAGRVAMLQGLNDDASPWLLHDIHLPVPLLD